LKALTLGAARATIWLDIRNAGWQKRFDRSIRLKDVFDVGLVRILRALTLKG